MNLRAALVVAVAVACVPLSIAFASRVLVPARVVGSGYWVTSSIIAVAIAPFLIALVSGASWWSWCYGLLAAAPYAAGLLLRGRARAAEGSPLGLRPASELALWAMCIALTAGVAFWGWAYVE